MEKKPVRFNLKLNPDLHERLRRYAFEGKLSMQHVAHALLESSLDRVSVKVINGRKTK